MKLIQPSHQIRKGQKTVPAALCAVLLAVCLTGGVSKVKGQGLSLRGELSLAGTLSDADEAQRQVMARYLPEISLGFPLSESLTLDLSGSANLWAYGVSSVDGKDLSSSDAEPYRAWLRLSAPRFEVRAGLQKISFGSANLFRPLMWFDRLDPRDPLQLTEGVWGVLARVYLPGNVTGWGWAVSGEDERKGWEIIPTLEGAAEGGGRLQIPFGPGEVAGSYNHRRLDIGSLGTFPAGAFPATGDEHRFAIDGKWDLELGIWVEAVFTRQESQALEKEWIQALSVGADYTFEFGNGLTVLAEHLYKENPSFRTVSSPAGSGFVEAEDPPAEPDGLILT